MAAFCNVLFSKYGEFWHPSFFYNVVAAGIQPALTLAMALFHRSKKVLRGKHYNKSIELPCLV
jgi:hypothetical protein